MYCIYFYADHGIDLESFYLLEVKDLKRYISNNNVYHHAEKPESPAPSECTCYKNHANILVLLNIYYFNVPIQCQYFIQLVNFINNIGHQLEFTLHGFTCKRACKNCAAVCYVDESPHRAYIFRSIPILIYSLHHTSS